MAPFLLLATLTALPARAAPSDTDPTPTSAPAAATTDDPWSAPDIAPRIEPRLIPRRHADPAAPPDTKAAVTTQSPWVRTTAALAAVVAVILLLGWGYRAVLGTGPRSWATRGRQPALLEVVSRTALSTRQSLCLVRCGPRLVLLGITADSIRPLDVITDADVTARLLGEAARQRPDSSTAEFARCLEREAHSYSDDHAQPTPPDAADDHQLAALRDRLADTLSKLHVKTGGA
jgi:flagellar biogenesis protein FliO